MPEPGTPLEMSSEEFRRAGRELVDRIADFLGSLPERPLTLGETPTEIRALLGRRPVPRKGSEPAALLRETADLLFGHSLFSGHSRFMGYITSSAAPIGALADLLAAAINPNVGGWELSPIASEIEAESVRWIAELVGYPSDCGGLLVSGGNMANFGCFLAGRRAMLGEEVRRAGLAGADAARARVYVSQGTHTWIQKAADLFGLGTDAVRWIPTDARQRMLLAPLREQIRQDIAAGDRPIMVVGAAGTVSTGAIDPLRELAAICREHGLWFHVDGAYGAPAAVLSDAPDDLRALSLADSLAVDPHKWLYAPLEAGCVLVREAHRLSDAYSYSPAYYRFDTEGEEPPINYHELGLQNSRGFRALKVWLGIRQAGRDGLAQMIGHDCRMAEALYRGAEAHPELEAVTLGLSIATFRYVPADLAPGTPSVQAYLNALNEALLARLKRSGDLFVTNAVLDGTFLLRACIVNFRTSEADVSAIPEIVARAGRTLDAELRPHALQPA
ncbi:MAG TPA: aminotransferase class V-fold PLP-dependent enzyme [Gemmatimonadales bacterium]|jgi:glutamate/tyrosine decarboxylase-like PLP-dependent enzyme|nr:aminotransferase class V-fold PLP-dependent enzyme [Gemmatimonadales bacterium]